MNEDLNQANKRVVWDFWTSLEATGPNAAESVAESYMTPDMPWHGPDPIIDLRGPGEFTEAYWDPLRASFTGLRRETHMFLGGRSNGRADGSNDGHNWAGGTGLFHGVFATDWLGIPASGQSVSLRWGELCRVDNGRIAETFILLDLVDLLQQAGYQVLAPARGRNGVWPAPADDDAILLVGQDPAESEQTLQLIRRFIFDSLNVYDQENLASMGVASFFTPGIQWFGPGGIGYCDGLNEFENLHQRHWLHAFPDRAVQDLDCLFAEGAYTGAAGWNGVLATHAGEYLDCPATGKRLGVNGLDFWRRAGDKFIENWVFVDMVHLFRQLEVNLLERVRG